MRLRYIIEAIHEGTGLRFKAFNDQSFKGNLTLLSSPFIFASFREG